MSGTVTPNFRLQKPPFDDIPWDDAVNGNMDIIDSALAQYLTIANFAGVWKNSTSYGTGQVLIDAQDSTMWQCVVAHTSAAAPTLFSADRANRPTLWSRAAGTVSPTATNAANIGRNLIHNPLFNIAQRGAGPFTTNNGYTADRWLVGFGASDTAAVSITGTTDAYKTTIGDESAQSILNISFTGSAASNGIVYVGQKIERISRLAGKTVTLSFYANSNVANLKIGVSFNINYGTGGSPSALLGVPPQVATLSGTPLTFTRSSFTFQIPSMVGKTLGTANNDSTDLLLWLSSGSSFAAASGIGVQSGAVNFWGVQLEIGSIATPLEKPDPRYDLSNCQRFFERLTYASSTAVGIGSSQLTTTPPTAFGVLIPYSVSKRAIPTITSSALSTFSITGFTPISITFAPDQQRAFAAFAASGGSVQNWAAIPVATAAGGGAFFDVSADL